MARHLATILAALALALVLPGVARAAEPPALALHPENPHYFVFRGKPAVLVGSTEHYGAVLNGDFDFIPYLDELQGKGLNLTRTFSGVYREVPGSFNIRNNTLAPRPGKYVSPWAKAGAGEKYDLTKWNETYFRRLRAFVSEASRRGVVVEYVLFCTYYEDVLWDICPLNVKNNVNGVGRVARTDVCTLKEKALVDVQLAFVRKALSELKDYDNVYYEVCNEPYFAGVADDWQRLVAQTVVDTEADFPPSRRHLVARNIANGSQKIDNPDPNVSIFNFHYCNPPDAVKQNRDLNRPISYDETGFRGTGDAVYRTHGWEFLLAGGAAYDHLDYSFTPDAENGTAPVTDPTPGGGGATLRRQFQSLKTFMESIDFVHMKPDAGWIKGASDGARHRALAQPGVCYAAYLSRVVEEKGSDGKGRGKFYDPASGQQTKLTLSLPPGRYRAQWLDPKTGQAATEGVTVKEGAGEVTVTSPAYDQDVVLRLERER